MTERQEDVLFDFLENVTEPFSLESAVEFVRLVEPKGGRRLAEDIRAFINSRNIAFKIDEKQWISRRGCFEPVRFVISPTRLELLNGILIPGHRCVPFANPALLPQEYTFFWAKKQIPFTITEGAPEEFYPYYSIYGEEYAPQYVARDNPENESAFNSDPYDDPPQVSLHTLDMRNIYRQSGFVPGDRFVITSLDWKKGSFSLERVAKDGWSETDLSAWLEAAEGGFASSFERLGPSFSTEEQIAYAYWYGGQRMREVPAYALEDFLYEKTDRIETAAYGIETRFWYAGKEIPDRKELDESQILPDRTAVEDLIFKKGIPISEYVIQSYVRDALFRNDLDITRIIDRIVPPVAGLTKYEWKHLADYVLDVFKEFKKSYSVFSDKGMGPIRQRVGELHTAVIDLAARLKSGDMDSSWLPKHTYVILSQIQGHAASVLIDLDTDEAPLDTELEAMDNSLDSMIDTYEDIKNLIDEALDNFRRNNISVIKDLDRGKNTTPSWRLIQVSLGGTDVWRRLAVPEAITLEELHRLIQTVFGWNNAYMHRFIRERPFREGGPGKPQILDTRLTLNDLNAQGLMEALYEYGVKWAVKIILLSRSEAVSPVRCVAGAGAAPPETVDGPLRFRRFLAALEGGSEAEKKAAERELGKNFDSEAFDMEACNRLIWRGEYENKR